MSLVFVDERGSAGRLSSERARRAAWRRERLAALGEDAHAFARSLARDCDTPSEFRRARAAAALAREIDALAADLAKV